MRILGYQTWFWGTMLVVGDHTLFFVTSLLVIAVLIALGRLVLMVVGAIVHANQSAERYRSLSRDLRARGGWPPISILVPAYNEGPVIRAAVEAVMRSDYPEFEIIVVNDGSQDETASEIEPLTELDSRVRLITHPKNRGKAAALNTGLASAAHGIIVTIDADTWLTPRTLKFLVLNVLAGRYAGVTANIKIGNQNRILTVWQQIEYVTGIHAERRSLSLIGSVTTLAGACSAFDRKALEAVGGFPTGTLAEDTDVTLRLLEAGYRTTFEPRAVALTEAPSSLHDLYKQRFRWLYGNFQCVGRHLVPVFGAANGWLKWVAFPNLVLSGILLFLFIPIFLYALGRAIFEPSLATILPLPGYFAADLIASVVAFSIERERGRLMLHALPQRVFYLLFMGWVFLRVIAAGVMVERPGWAKITRVGMGR